MNWYWKVRIYNKEGQYWHGQVITSRDLKDIANIQDFYGLLTGCRMLIEGMSELEDENTVGIQEAFADLWKTALASTECGGK